jgi:hypothetical protein
MARWWRRLRIWPLSAAVVAGTISAGDGDLRVPDAERDALERLFHSTNGPSWGHKEGWLGPRGSECSWYGVACKPSKQGHGVGLFVEGLDLRNNNLGGRLPNELLALGQLRHLDISGNQITLPLPTGLLDRVDAGELMIEPLTLISTVDEVMVRVHNPAVRCADYQLTLRSDGSGERIVKRCDNARDSEYCVRQWGRVNWFHHLARFTEKAGFFRGENASRRSAGGMDSGEVTFVVQRDGERQGRTVNGLSLSLDEWLVLSTVNGMVAQAGAWEEERLPQCPAEMESLQQ